MYPFFEIRSDLLHVSVSDNLSFPLHLHPHLELFFLSSGETEVTIRRETRRITKGSLAVIFPNQIHSYQALSENTRSTLIICALPMTGGFGDTLLKYHPTTPFLLPDELHPHVSFVINALMQENPHENNQAACNALIQLLLARILPNLVLHHNSSSDSESLTYQIAQYISEHFQEKVTLEMLARHLGVSKFHLSHIFSEKMGQNFPSYLAKIRLDYASFLLSGTDLPVTQICEESGFSSHRTFFRSFKEHYGLTPLEYRNRFRSS